MVKDCDDDLRGADNENKMDAVQDRFPHDDLQLQKAEKTQVMSAHSFDLPTTLSPCFSLLSLSFIQRNK